MHKVILNYLLEEVRTGIFSVGISDQHTFGFAISIGLQKHKILAFSFYSLITNRLFGAK